MAVLPQGHEMCSTDGKIQVMGVLLVMSAISNLSVPTFAYGEPCIFIGD